MSCQHHETGPTNQEDDSARKRFIDELLGRSKREYPHGRIGPDDDGESAFAIAYDPVYKVIRVEFPTPMKWLALDLESAIKLRDILGAKLKEMELAQK